MININDDFTFSEEILNNSGSFLVEFRLPWCGSYHVIESLIEQLTSEQHSKIKILKLNVENLPKTMQKLNITSVPTFVFFDKGKEVERWISIVNFEKEFREKLDSFFK